MCEGRREQLLAGDDRARPKFVPPLSRANDPSAPVHTTVSTRCAILSDRYAEVGERDTTWTRHNELAGQQVCARGPSGALPSSILPVPLNPPTPPTHGPVIPVDTTCASAQGNLS